MTSLPFSNVVPSAPEGHELALGQLEHVVAAIDEDDVVRPPLLHDVAGAQVALFVEQLGRRLGTLEVAGVLSMVLTHSSPRGYGLSVV